MGLSRLILVLLILLCHLDFCLAQKRDTLSVLFVGNSYTYISNIPHLVSLISDSTQTKLKTSKCTAGGAKLSDHWRSKRGLKTKEIIRNGNFDIVVLQEQSMGTITYPDSFLIYVQKFSGFIKESGAQPYLYQTWARKNTPELQETITRVYNQGAKKNNTETVRVGEAWQLANQQRPGIELYLPDKSHQSPLGAFLAACVFIEAITGEIPKELSNFGYDIMDNNAESVSLALYDPVDVAFCLDIVRQLAKN